MKSKRLGSAANNASRRTFIRTPGRRERGHPTSADHVPTLAPGVQRVDPVLQRPVAQGHSSCHATARWPFKSRRPGHRSSAPLTEQKLPHLFHTPLAVNLPISPRHSYQGTPTVAAVQAGTHWSSPNSLGSLGPLAASHAVSSAPRHEGARSNTAVQTRTLSKQERSRQSAPATNKKGPQRGPHKEFMHTQRPTSS